MQNQDSPVTWFYDKIKSHFEHDGDLLETIMFTQAIAKQKEKQKLKECWDAAHQAGRFEGKGIAEENWQTFDEWYAENFENA